MGLAGLIDQSINHHGRRRRRMTAADEIIARSTPDVGPCKTSKLDGQRLVHPLSYTFLVIILVRPSPCGIALLDVSQGIPSARCCCSSSCILLSSFAPAFVFCRPSVAARRTTHHRPIAPSINQPLCRPLLFFFSFSSSSLSLSQPGRL